MGIRHILARVAHPQTNDKLERARGEVRRNLRLFHDVAGSTGICHISPSHIETDLVARFVKWYSCERPHMSPDAYVGETPAMAFERKTPPPGSDGTDE